MSALCAQAQDYPEREKLRAHSNEFRKDVIQVTDGVFVAVGYASSNVILIQGEGGSIIVDTSTDLVAARQIVEAFGARVRTPVRAIIYTHSHPDHTGGARAFAGSATPEIYSHQSFLQTAPDAGRAGRDGGDQFGMTLPASLFINAGVQAEFGRAVPPSREGYLPPTRTFAGDDLSVTIAGVRVQLLRTPGETTDTIAVWLPHSRVLMPGDNFYRAFPNVSPIRGARLRSPEAWVASLDLLIALQADHVVPSHTRPVLGSNSARAALSAYRDGFKSVLDQTAEGIRKGERPDELVAHVKLPPGWPGTRSCRSSTAASSGRCAVSTPIRSAGSTATRPGSSLCVSGIARRNSWRSSAASTARSRVHEPRLPPATSPGRQSWPTPCC